MQERQYQRKAHSDLRASYRSGKRAPLFCCPTGGGKTHVAKDIIEAAVAKRRHVLFLAPRRELIFQSSKKLTAHGISHGIIMAGESPRDERVQVASVPTLYSRAVMRNKIPFPDASVVVIDEAHLVRGEMTMRVLAQYPDAVKIGLTATPCRGDGKGLGAVFDDLVMGPSVQELIDQGYLVQPRYYVPSKPDLTGVKVKAGDYNTAQLGRAMNNKTLVGDVLSNWMRLASDRKTVIFTVDVAHSLHIEQVFRDAGVRIAHIDADTPKDERAQILADLRSGVLQVVTNCDVLTLGWDEPSVSCCVLARPTKSLVRYLQAVGRALRPAPGKSDCLVLDHGNCIAEHGLAEDKHDWSLTLDSTVGERDAKRKKEMKDPKDVVCGDCKFVFRLAGQCPVCGWKLPHAPANVDIIEDDLAELTRERKKLKREWTPQQQRQFFAELLHVCAGRGHAPGWASWKFKEKFGTFPRGMGSVSPALPQPETIAWLKHIQIRGAKRREKERRAQGVAA